MPNRAVYAALAWVAATATAMAVVWAGLDSVIPTATAGPHVATVAAWPVQDAQQYPSPSPSTARPTPSAASSGPPASVAHTAVTIPPATMVSAPAVPSSPATTPPSVPSSTSAGAPTTPSGTEGRYTTAGGTVVLTLYANSAVLDAATPASGFSARSWTNTDELEVEFSPADGGTVYEVIATWNGTSPQVNTYAIGG